MKQSKTFALALTGETQNIDQKLNREELIQNKVKHIEIQVKSKLYKKFNFFYDNMLFFSIVTLLAIFTYISYIDDVSTYFQISNNVVRIISLMVLLPTLIFFGMAMSEFGSKEYFLNSIKELKSLLESNPYETRIEHVKGTSLLKILVEENIKEGGLVMKISSRHFTSYLDLNNSPENVFRGIQEIINQQEKMFSKKS